MQLELKDSPFWGDKIKDVFIKSDKNTLKIMYGGTDDLYMDIFGEYSVDENGNDSASFVINKNDEVYSHFETLYNNIVSAKIGEWQSPRFNAMLKFSGAYNDLVKPDGIYFYSDNIYNEKANLLKITKDEQKISLNFVSNKEDPAWGFSIRICNSGSKYTPFNVCFMTLYNNLSRNESVME